MIVGIIAFTGFGAAFLGIGFLFLEATEKPGRARTKGHVVDVCLDAVAYNSGLSGADTVGLMSVLKHSETRYPIFEYAVDGVIFRRAHPVSFKRAALKRMMEKPLIVYYDPLYPEKGSLTKHTFLGILGKCFIPAGISFLFIGIVCMLCHIKAVAL